MPPLPPPLPRASTCSAASLLLLLDTAVASGQCCPRSHGTHRPWVSGCSSSAASAAATPSCCVTAQR
jgi:hypothetical protein